MNRPLEQHPSPDPREDRLLDRLVDGELSDAERRALLRRFEQEPDGWRRCALAFLEAQSWSEAIRPLVAPALTAANPVILPNSPSRKREFRRRLARLTGLAAGVFVAFALGWALRGGPDEKALPPSLAQGPGAVPVVVSEPPPSAPTRFAGGDSRTAKPAEISAAIDPLVKHWEQRGYHAEMQKRLVAMEFKDGRKLNVPVHEVRLRYVGSPTY